MIHKMLRPSRLVHGEKTGRKQRRRPTDLISEIKTGRHASRVSKVAMKKFQLGDSFSTMVCQPRVIVLGHIKCLLQELVVAVPAITL